MALYRLLYVGNDLEFLNILRKILTKPRCHIVYCPHIGSAILFLKGNPRYDLLMIDLELDGKRRGIELARITRSISHRADLPVVIMTNETINNLYLLNYHSVVNAWLSKRKISACSEIIIPLLKSGHQQ